MKTHETPTESPQPRGREHRPPIRVSVICTAKNAAATIERTIVSILAQDVTDWEMVVVDDGSTDDTAAIVDAFARTDPRVRLVRTTGVGRARALNLALAEAGAPLVANTDADDESHPERLRQQLEGFQRHPEFVLLCSDDITIKDDQRPSWPQREGDPAPPPVVEITRQLMLGNPINHSSIMMRRSEALTLGGYRHRLVEDYDLWVRLIEAGHRIGKLERPLVARRIHSGNWFLSSPRLRYLFDGAKIQAHVIWNQDASKLYYWMVLVLRVLYSFLPLGMRLRRRSWTR